jgi:hypothetical protein
VTDEVEPPIDAFGRPKKKCEFWMCNVWIPNRPSQKFCSRQCKSADSKRRSRKADPTRQKRREQGRMEGSEQGHLYVIQPGSEPIVKVGYSNSLPERLRTLNTAHYHELRIIASRPVERFLKNDPPDKLVHLELPEVDHMKGEWWRLTEEVVEVLNRHQLTVGSKSYVSRESVDGDALERNSF